MPQGNAGLMEREGAAVRHVYLVLNVLRGSREIAGGARLARAVPGPHLDGGFLRKNVRSDLQSDHGAKVTNFHLEHPHSLPLPSLRGARVCPYREPGSSRTFPVWLGNRSTERASGGGSRGPRVRLGPLAHVGRGVYDS